MVTYSKNRNTSGFTLIELLVVIAIIGVLSSVVLSSLNSARVKARDAKRMAEIHQMRTALALYFNDYGTYPPSGGATTPNVFWSQSSIPTSWRSSALQTALAPYLSRLPMDPINSNSGWIPTGNEYFYVSNFGSWGCTTESSYIIVYRLENGASTISPGLRACDGTQVQYGGGSLDTSNIYGIITVGDITK